MEYIFSKTINVLFLDNVPGDQLLHDLVAAAVDGLDSGSCNLTLDRVTSIRTERIKIQGQGIEHGCIFFQEILIFP